MAQRLTARQRGKLFLNAIRRSELVRSLNVVPGIVPYRRLNRSGEPLLIDIETRMGMGAIISMALRLQSWAAHKGIAVNVVSTSSLYSVDGGDVLARYFEQPVTPRGQPVSRLAREWIYRNEAPRHLDLRAAANIFTRQFVPNVRLRALIDEAAGGTEPFNLSIHFRATDKYLETGIVQYDHMLEAARPYLEEASRVFLATDDARFAHTIRQRWPHVEFTSYDLGEVAKGKARHFSDLGADEKAKEALVNMFLIARAPVCIRTMSYLSSFARIIHSDLQTITVNRRIDRSTPFPERQILEHEISARP